MLATSKEDLYSFFENIEEPKKRLAFDTIDEYYFFAEQIAELRKLPLIRVAKSNTELQQLTPAAKLIKDYSNVLDAKRGTLLRIINQQESSAADELLAKLSEFE